MMGYHANLKVGQWLVCPNRPGELIEIVKVYGGRYPRYDCVIYYDNSSTIRMVSDTEVSIMWEIQEM